MGSVSDMAGVHDALKRAENAADQAEAAATRLEMETEAPYLDKAAADAKGIIHSARVAIDDIEDDAAAGLVNDEQVAKMQAAAAAVEDELKEMAAELDDATVEGAKAEIAAAAADTDALARGASVLTRAPTFKSTEQAVKELELLAKKKAKGSIQGSTIVIGLWAGWALLTLFGAWLFGLWGGELAWSGALGVLWGMAASALYYQNRRWKQERSQRLAMIPGAKGIQALMHHLPSWISFSDTEKMEWLNTVLAKAWPYYDQAICEEVKSQVEPLMEKYRPPGMIKRIYFKKLNFGDAPFRVEGIRVDTKVTDRVQIDVDFRWAGDANIHLAIELPAGGNATRMVPKVSDIAVSGTARVILSPLLPEIPGFGAATVSLMKPPVVKFHLDFGAAFGGSYTASAIVAWLDPFLRSTVVGMLVWPKRIVVPILPEEITGSLDDLYLRHKGALQIDVLSADGLPKMDRFGTADPYVEIYTTSDLVEKTTVMKNTLTPVWGERLWLLVQEPESQFAYVTMNDVDFVNVKDLFSKKVLNPKNVLKNATSVFNAKNLMGRTMLPVKQYAEAPTEAHEVTMPLGLGEFNDEDGCGGGRGELKLRVTYWPLGQMDGHADSKYGALIVTLQYATALAAADLPIDTSDPYVKFTYNKETRKSTVVPSNLDPKWEDAKFDWFKVPSTEKLSVAVYDYDQFSSDELLGRVEIDLQKEVLTQPGGDVTKTWPLTDVPKEWLYRRDLEIKQSTITMRLQWIPFTYNKYNPPQIQKARK